MDTTIFMAALSAIAKRWKRPMCPQMDEWINKMWFTDTMALKRKEIQTNAPT